MDRPELDDFLARVVSEVEGLDRASGSDEPFDSDLAKARVESASPDGFRHGVDGQSSLLNLLFPAEWIGVVRMLIAEAVCDVESVVGILPSERAFDRLMRDEIVRSADYVRLVARDSESLHDALDAQALRAACAAVYAYGFGPFADPGLSEPCQADPEPTD